MKWIRKHLDDIEILILAVFVFGLFYKISSCVPLAGDDWGYAIQGTNGNAFVQAWKMYFSWSGRLVSEFYGAAMAPHKGVWNYFNALLFTMLFIGITLLSRTKKNRYLLPVLILALMMGVNETMRIETYTWLMGTTYVIPLVLTVYYLLIIRHYYFAPIKLPKSILTLCIIMNVLICLCMENIAAALVFGNILLSGYLHHTKNNHFKKSLWILGFSIIGLLLIRFSPGAMSRMTSDNAAFNALSLFEKIQTNWPIFLKRTFADNTYLMVSFSTAMGLAAMQRLQKGKFICMGMHAVACINALAVKIYEKTGIAALLVLFDTENTEIALIYCSIFYIAYIAVCLYQMLKESDTKYRDTVMFFFLLAGCANAVMLISPIFGARSALYTYYFLLIIVGYTAGTLELKKAGNIIAIVVFSLLIVMKTREFKYKYSEVAAAAAERESIIEYYRENPDVKEAWIPRMPKGWIHSADVEESDTYHMQVFKQYYGLADDVTVIFFNEE